MVIAEDCAGRGRFSYPQTKDAAAHHDPHTCEFKAINEVKEHWKFLATSGAFPVNLMEQSILRLLLEMMLEDDEFVQ